MSDSSYILASLLDKMANADADIRYMALTDIGGELSKGGGDSISLHAVAMSEHVEKKVVAAILKALADKNSECQNLAVKTLTPLVRKVRESQVIEIIDHLGKLLAEDKDEMKDIASIGCKTVVMELNPGGGSGGAGVGGKGASQAAVKRMLPIMAELMSKNNNVQIDIIDIVSECVARFGAMIVTEQAPLAVQVQTQLLSLLNHPRPAVRKRTIAAIGNLVVHVSDDMLHSLVAFVVKMLRERAAVKDYDKLRTYIACVGTLGRFTSRRIGKYMNEFTNLIFEYSSFEDDELRENCFQTLESFIVRCPAEVTPFLDKIIDIGLLYIKHDPNYDDGDDEDVENGMQVDEDTDVAKEEGSEDGEEDNEEDEDDDGDYSDADDVSWKVRRASAKLLSAVISTRSELVTELFSRVAPVVISRFKEREESVRVDVLHAFVALVRQVGASSGAAGLSGNKNNWRNASQTSLESDPRALLMEQIPNLCKTLPKQMNGKSMSTRQTGFTLLHELVVILHGGLDDKLSLFIPAIEASLTTTSPSPSSVKVLNNPNLKIEVLQFLHAVLTMHENAARSFQQHLERLVHVAVVATNESFYKITSEALGVLMELVKVIRPLSSSPTSSSSAASITTAQNLVQQIYTVVLASARTVDVDIEVKERSLLALATVLSQAGDLLPREEVISTALPLLTDRLKSEVTRQTGLRAIKTVADSQLLDAGGASTESLIVGLNAVAEELLQLASGFLRKSHRMLRLTALATLESLLRRSATTPVLTLPRSAVLIALAEISTLLQTTPELDVHLFPLCLSVVTASLAQDNAVVDKICETIVPVIVRTMFELPHLVNKGVGLDVLLAFWSPLVAARPAVFGKAVELLTGPFGVAGSGVVTALSRQAYRPVAESVAVLASRVAPATAVPIVNNFVKVIVDGANSKNQALLNLSLLVVGSIGRTSDLSMAYPTLHESIVALFASPEEEIKHAAAYALGNMSLGNLTLYMPAVLGHMRQGGKKRYLVLIALKEIISRSSSSTCSTSSLLPHAAELWDLLFSNSQDAGMEDATRSVVAECLGKLLLLDPRNRLAALRVQLQSESAAVRATVVSAVRHTITDATAKDEFDVAIGTGLIDFLRLNDADLTVRHISLVTLNSTAHNRPHLIRGILSQLLPSLYAETAVKQDLITVVEMGPFKHRVDNGLEVRKSAFECMYTLLENCLSRIELSTFLDHVLIGLADAAQEIKLLNHLILQRLSACSPTALLSHLDDAAGPLKDTIDTKPKASAVKQEIEKIADLVRSAIRTVVVLSRVVARGGSLEGSATTAAPKFDELVKGIMAPGTAVYDVYVGVKNELDNKAQLGNGLANMEY